MTVLVGEEMITQNIRVEETDMNIYHPKKYLDMIRPHLRDFINYHKPTTELNKD